MITNTETRTAIDEIADGIHRIHTPVELPGGQRFSFNQYLLVDDEPLLFHTGPRRMFALVREAMAAVIPVERLPERERSLLVMTFYDDAPADAIAGQLGLSAGASS